MKTIFSNYYISHTDSTLRQLVRLAIPVIAVSFMSMAYNFINMIFVGKLGSDAVAAVGTAGFYLNLSWSLSAILTVGAGIKVSHSIGENNLSLAKSYVRSGILAVFVVAFVYYIVLIFFGDYLIRFVKLNNTVIEQSATTFLLLAGISIPFNFQNLFFTSVFIGYGDSQSPFRINALSFVINIVLDPIFIFGLGLGIKGAAIATIIAQASATVLFYKKLVKTPVINPLGVAFRSALLKNIVKLGVSPAIQRVSFTIVTIFIARIIANWGPVAIAVQKIGVQIEAISYMTAAGFMSALASISGIAYGAKNYDKQWKSFKSGMNLAFVIGIPTSLLLIVFPKILFSIFLSDPESVKMGKDYLIILGFSQLFMCLEYIATGAFFGWGKTNIPAITSISLTVLRIPMAIAFIHFWSNSLNSVWWSITLSSVAKGTILALLFPIMFKFFLKKKAF